MALLHLGRFDVSGVAGGSVNRQKILFVVNSPDFFLSHRLPLAIAARDHGYEVHVATMPGESVSEIMRLGLQHHSLKITRSGQKIPGELNGFFSMFKLFRDLKPALVHLVTIKPVIYGGIAARLGKVGGVVSAVSGLGFVFISKSFKATITRILVKFLYRVAFGKENLRVIFQNETDRNTFINQKLVADRKTILIRGSGVDLSTFPLVSEPANMPRVVMASRLLVDKGVNEFIEACKVLKQRSVQAEFWIVGDVDPENPSSLTESDLVKIKQEGFVHVEGFSNDISSLFQSANLVVLPSYREGLPKVLVEAAAAGRAVITTDVPGCRDAIEPNISGLLVPVKDSGALASAIERLINDADLRKRMGLAGRELAEREFAIDKIVAQHLDIYKQLIGES